LQNFLSIERKFCKSRKFVDRLVQIVTLTGVAQKTATRIESDFHRRDEGYYDPTLLKYKPHVLGKTATEISAPELFNRFTKHQAKVKVRSQQKKPSQPFSASEVQSILEGFRSSKYRVNIMPLMPIL
jgi:hypothetical protein